MRHIHKHIIYYVVTVSRDTNKSFVCGGFRLMPDIVYRQSGENRLESKEIGNNQNY